jgi:predicted amidohydrolase YtcJ
VEITEAASNYAASLGVTSVQDVHSDDLLATYRSMAKSGRLETRIYECVGMSGWKRNPSIAPPTATGDDMVRGGCIKGMSDGSPEEIAELSADVSRADRAGHQVMIHAIGRRANENTINAFAFAIHQNGKRDRRFRIEHAHNIARPEIARLRALGIIASMQPALFYDGSDAGDDYPFLFRSRADVAFGSDASMIDIDPLMGIHAAVNSGANSISVETAVRSYTLGSAYAEFQEKQKGSIEVGKLADLVVLSRDIFTIPRAEIKNAKVETTILGGKIVYSAEKVTR